MRCRHSHFSSFLVLPSQPLLLPLSCHQVGLIRLLPLLHATAAHDDFFVLLGSSLSVFSAGGCLGINGLSRCIRNTLLVVLHMI
jgi:hypothetical protein